MCLLVQCYYVYYNSLQLNDSQRAARIIYFDAFPTTPNARKVSNSDVDLIFQQSITLILPIQFTSITYRTKYFLHIYSFLFYSTFHPDYVNFKPKYLQQLYHIVGIDYLYRFYCVFMALQILPANLSFSKEFFLI